MQTNSGIRVHENSYLDQAQATERRRQVEAPTTKAANNVGKKKSRLDLLITACWGKHTISVGKSKGILTNSPPTPLQGCLDENDEGGDIANRKATPGATDATVTVTIKRSVHVTALSNRRDGSVDTTCRKREWKQRRDMIMEK
ncbi:hypothetical protein DEO72_LG10g469 [Vigna unguiculata]|uniref:Uncharacterized protein n=1 Tax=Vigna unguiculata TaxID=3917 RepID=A0A4D6N614_VIGUN|nr:hypothetical protein DEO72_LG10g469 [Vigna unguiculata]